MYTHLSKRILAIWFEYSPWFSLFLTCLTSKLPLQKPKRFLWNLFSLLQDTSIFGVIWPTSCSSYQNGCPTIMPCIATESGCPAASQGFTLGEARWKRKLSWIRSVSNISFKSEWNVSLNFTLERPFTLAYSIWLLNTGRQIGVFHCKFSLQYFFLLAMATNFKVVAGWSAARER